MATEFQRTGITEIDIPTPSQYRIKVGTECSATMDDASYRVVAKHLGNSTDTQRRFYESATCDGALQAYKKLDELAKNRVWPDDDIQLLLTTWPLTNKKQPSTKVCTFIQQHLKICRTIHNIIEKWQYLKKKQ